MEKFNLTEKYALCMLSEREDSLENGDLVAHLVTSMIFEMVLDGNLKLTANQVKITDKIPDIDYNKKLYDYIKEMKKDEINIEEVLPFICTNDKKKEVITESLKNAMLNQELISTENKKTLLGNKEIITVNNSKLEDVIKEVKSGMLNTNEVSEEIKIFGALLNATIILTKILNKNEKELLNNKMKEIEKNNATGINAIMAHAIIYEIETSNQIIVMNNLIDILF